MLVQGENTGGGGIRNNCYFSPVASRQKDEAPMSNICRRQPLARLGHGTVWRSTASLIFCVTLLQGYLERLLHYSSAAIGLHKFLLYILAHWAQKSGIYTWTNPWYSILFEDSTRIWEAVARTNSSALLNHIPRFLYRQNLQKQPKSVELSMTLVTNIYKYLEVVFGSKN